MYYERREAVALVASVEDLAGRWVPRAENAFVLKFAPIQHNSQFGQHFAVAIVLTYLTFFSMQKFSHKKEAAAVLWLSRPIMQMDLAPALLTQKLL